MLNPQNIPKPYRWCLKHKNTTVKAITTFYPPGRQLGDRLAVVDGMARLELIPEGPFTDVGLQSKDHAVPLAVWAAVLSTAGKKGGKSPTQDLTTQSGPQWSGASSQSTSRKKENLRNFSGQTATCKWSPLNCTNYLKDPSQPRLPLMDIDTVGLSGKMLNQFHSGVRCSQENHLLVYIYIYIRICYMFTLYLCMLFLYIYISKYLYVYLFICLSMYLLCLLRFIFATSSFLTSFCYATESQTLLVNPLSHLSRDSNKMLPPLIKLYQLLLTRPCFVYISIFGGFKTVYLSKTHHPTLNSWSLPLKSIESINTWKNQWNTHPHQNLQISRDLTHNPSPITLQKSNPTPSPAPSMSPPGFRSRLPQEGDALWGVAVGLRGRDLRQHGDHHGEGRDVHHGGQKVLGATEFVGEILWIIYGSWIWYGFNIDG